MSEAEQPLIVRRDGPIAQLRFNRPAVLNALDRATARFSMRAVRSPPTTRCAWWWLAEQGARSWLAEISPNCAPIRPVLRKR